MWPQCNAGMQIAVREFKNRFSELLKRAEAGEEIVVTSHGRSRRTARSGCRLRPA